MLQLNLTRAASLIKSFKQVAIRQSSVEHEDFLFGEAFTASVASLHTEWRRAGIDVKVVVEREARLNAAPRFVFQFGNHLVINAIRHAFPDGRRRQVAFTIGRAGPRLATVVYEDDGVGVPEDVLRRMWEPLFTTKRGLGGSGLGLHIVWNLVSGEQEGRTTASNAAEGAYASCSSSPV